MQQLNDSIGIGHFQGPVENSQPDASYTHTVIGVVGGLSKGSDPHPPKPVVRYRKGWISNIPAELRERAQWVCWGYRFRNDRWTKLPYQARWGFDWATGKNRRFPASSTDPETFATFSEAHAAFWTSKGYLDGMGMALTGDDPFFAGDIDHCIGPDGTVEPWALEILGRFATYWEVSPSGTGIRFFGKGVMPGGKGRKAGGLGPDGKGALELYDRGHYLTTTGNTLPDSPAHVVECQEALDRTLAELFPADSEPAKAPRSPARTPREPLSLTDNEILEIAYRSKHGREIKALMDGDTSGYGGDHSRADLALCSHLAFWFRGDAHAIDRVFRQSGLNRDKWDRDDYREGTIAKAVAGTTDFYEPERRSAGDDFPIPFGPVEFILPGDAPTWERPAEALPTELTPIARSIMEDLSGRVVSLHRAPTGSGKTFSIAQAAVERANAGLPTAVAVPTKQIGMDVIGKIHGFDPGLVERGAIADFIARRGPAGDGDDDAGDDAGDDPAYPIHTRTLIVICSHEQLMRRGFSRFLRRTWDVLGPGQDDDGSRPAFALIIDEADAYIAANRREIPLAHRRAYRANPDGSGGKLVALTECPLSNGSGNCSNCAHRGIGGETYFNKFGIRELGGNLPIVMNSEGECRKPGHPLAVKLEYDATLGPEIHAGGTTFAAKVHTWLGRHAGGRNRRAEEIELFQRNEDGKHPEESPNAVVEHMVRFGFRPVVATERPTDRETGEPIDPERLAQMFAKGQKPDLSKIQLPLATCEVPRLRFADLAGPEMLRRFAAQHNVGVVFAGATMTSDDADILREVFPGMVERTHPYPARKIRQAAVVFVGDEEKHIGAGSLVGRDGRLRTAPLESIGLGLIFVAKKSRARELYESVKLAHPSVALAIENDEERVITPLAGRDTPTRVHVTYTRGVMGAGINMLGLRYLVVDALAFRSIASFTPGELTPGAFERAKAEERIARIMQNVGRALRGEPGKTVALIVLNADAELRKVIVESESLIQGCELPPVVADGDDLSQIVDQAGRWLAADGGNWPEPDPAKIEVKAKGGRPSTGKRDAILKEAEDAIARGESWRDFSRRTNLNRVLEKDESDALKARFKAKAKNAQLTEV